MGLFGRKKEPPPPPAPPINLVARGAATPQDDQAATIQAKHAPGYLIAQQMLAHAIDNRAETVLLDYTVQGVAARYQIDGFWHNAPGMDRMSGDAMLAVLKLLSALNFNERRAKQQGSFGAEYRRKKFNCALTSQGTQTGERVLIQIEGEARKFESLADLGMRPKMADDLKGMLNAPKGMVIISAPPAQGFSTTFNLALMAADRYVRNFAEVADAASSEKPVENVPVTTFNAAAGETPMTVLPKLLRTYPDALVLRNLINAETVELMCEQVSEENRLVVAGVRAKDACEALMRVLMLKAPAAKLAPVISGVLCQRLVRKLCEQCKQPYPPPPAALQMLAKFGIPPGKIQALFRPHEGPLPLPPDAPKDAVPMPCPNCLGIGYFGRTAIFELLVMNDRLRQVLSSNPKLEVLRAEAAKSGFLSLQHEGILLVAKGVTSLPELLRVLKE